MEEAEDVSLNEHDISQEEVKSEREQSPAKDSTASDEKTDRKDLKTENEKLKKKYSKSKKKYEQSTKELEKIKTQHDVLELELDAQKEKITELNLVIQKLEEKRDVDGEGSRTSSGTDLREKAKQTDGLKVQTDFLTRQVMETRESEKYLREQVADALEAKEESERKMKDLQVRLKRFIKDDQVKDDRISTMEQELKEITQQVEELEKYVDEDQVQRIRMEASSAGSNGGQMSVTSEPSMRLVEDNSSSRSCTIL